MNVSDTRNNYNFMYDIGIFHTVYTVGYVSETMLNYTLVQLSINGEA